MMKNLTFKTDEDRWQAVLARDPRADNQFVFAVQTTGIFCRPSCRPATRCAKMFAFILMPNTPGRWLSPL
jgi:AraC family transcriptional regulator of adaptative response/methylated-DNA-[protein]-cysteine methyltransferase